jgi:hypothetical protein
MIKDIIFHIGDPKTGSSSIQKALHSRAWTCDSVSIAPQRELNASALANSINPRRNPKKYAREFSKKAQWAADTDADLGVISAEFFSSVKPPALVKALEKYLSAYAQTARVVAYVRPHASRIVSNYSQHVKVGAFIGGFREFLDLPEVRSKLVYTPRFECWQKVFADRFTLRAFIQEELKDHDVTTDFFHVALSGVPFLLERAGASNEAMMLEEVAGMRVVQSVLKKRRIPAFLRMPIGAAIGCELAALEGRSGNRLALNREQAKKILTHYRTDAQGLDARFFEGGPMERALVEASDRAAASVPPVRADAYFLKDAIEHLRGLARDLAKLVKAKPFVWRESYQLRTGQVHKDDVRALNESQQENIAAVWAILEQIVQTLAKDRIS